MQVDPNSNSASISHSECRGSKERGDAERKSQSAKEEYFEYRRFLQSLSLPIDQISTAIQEDDDDPDFCLNDAGDVDDADADPPATNQQSAASAMDILPSTAPRISLSASQMSSIRSLLSDHFQLCVQMRHLTLDDAELACEHRVCDALLCDLREKRRSAEQSMLTTQLHRMPYRRDGFNHAITRSLSTSQLKKQGSAQRIDTAFAIAGMGEYFAFNQRTNRSLRDNLLHLAAAKCRLKKRYTPRFTSLRPLKKGKKKTKNKKRGTPHLSAMERELLEVAMAQYGHSVARHTRRSTSRPIRAAPDWASIQRRYFPHKSVHFLQIKAGRLRKKALSKLKADSADASADVKNFGRSRAAARHMSANDTELLLKGIEVFGLSDWAAISTHFLPGWTRQELRKQYVRKVKPTLHRREQAHMLSRFHRRPQSQTQTQAPPKLDDCGSDFPVLSKVQEAQVLRDEFKLQQLRNRISSAMQAQHDKQPFTVNFFNPMADAQAKELLQSTNTDTDRGTTADKNMNTQPVQECDGDGDNDLAIDSFVHCLTEEQLNSLL